MGDNSPQADKTDLWIEAYLNSQTLWAGAAPGDIYFVDSGLSNAGTVDGKSKSKAVGSIVYADASLVTANQGDVVFVMPGHNEAVATVGGITLTTAGVTYVFLGEGQDRAKITFSALVGADMNIDVASITMVNPRFVAAIDALTGPIDVNATDFKIINGLYEDAANIDTTDCVIATAGATRLKIHGMKYQKANEGGTTKESFIQLNGVDDAELIDIHVLGEFDTGIIENVTDECLNILMRNLTLVNTEAGPSPGMVLDSNCDGVADNVLIRVASGTTYVSDLSDINWADSFGTGTDGASFDDPIGTAAAGGLEDKIDTIDGYHDVPVADTSDNAQIRDVVGNKDDAAIVGAATTSASLVGYVKQIAGGQIVIDAFHDVPTADSSDNAQMSDVVGNKADVGNTGVISDMSASLMAYAKQLVNTGDMLHADAANYLAVTASMSSATWNTQTAHEIAEVTGLVRLRVVPEVTANLAGATTTIALGTETTADLFIAATTGTFLDATEIWQSSTDANNISTIATSSVIDTVVSSDDVGYTIAGGSATGGEIVFHIWWEPMNATGAVAAGTGVAL